MHTYQNYKQVDDFVGFFAVNFWKVQFSFGKKLNEKHCIVSVSHRINNLRMDLRFFEIDLRKCDDLFYIDQEKTLFNEQKKTSC